MRQTVRNRFVAVDLGEGWFELARKPFWELRQRDHAGRLILSVFPVAEGVVMDLATIVHLEHERRRSKQERAPGSPWAMRETLLDQSTWSVGSLFCVASRHTWEVRAAPEQGLNYQAGWTVSDGRHTVEATLLDWHAEVFSTAASDGDAMMRSVRFEGPS